ncbi:MAG: OsmC family protein [Longimonas sp.]|uniref:OsmC family protein n=1 Tax=Longimonas sp. TaxID=2039626 RepID=UPI003976E8B0
MMVHLERINDAIQFEGTNTSGNRLTIASNADQDGVSPMEMTAMAVGGCSSIDILMILEKQKQQVDAFSVQVDGERADDHPRVFTKLHVHYTITGDVAPQKVRRAINLSLDTYCSVSNMIDTATITYTFTLNEKTYEGAVDAS